MHGENRACMMKKWCYCELFQAEDGKPDYIARIVELFESVDDGLYFMARWFYRAEDTVRLNFFMIFFFFGFTCTMSMNWFNSFWSFERVQVIKGHGDLVDKKRVFLSDVKDENPLDCIVSKVNIVKLTPNVSAVLLPCFVQMLGNLWILFGCLESIISVCGIVFIYFLSGLFKLISWNLCSR